MVNPSSRGPIHVCIVTTAHGVDDKRVNSKIAHSFRKAGFRVTWVGPGNAFYDQKNYNRDGIDFVLGPPIHGRVDRLLAARRIKPLAEKIPDVDVYFSPDPDAAPISARLARKKGARSIFDIHEIYHGALLERWLFGKRIEMAREWMRRRIGRACEACDLVVGVSDSVLDPVFQDSARRLVVRSCAPSWFADGPPADVCGAGRPPFTIMQGKGFLSYGTDSVLKAMELVQREAPGPRVVVMATGDPATDPTAIELRALAERQGITDALVIHHGVPLQEMPEVLRGCDAGLISYQRNLGVDILPNRLFEYLAMGIPVIAPNYAREIARIVDREQCGVLVDFERPEEIARAIIHLSQHPETCREMGRRGREGFLARHNLEVEVEPLLERIRGWYPEKAGIRN